MSEGKAGSCFLPVDVTAASEADGGSGCGGVYRPPPTEAGHPFFFSISLLLLCFRNLDGSFQSCPEGVLKRESGSSLFCAAFCPNIFARRFGRDWNRLGERVARGNPEESSVFCVATRKKILCFVAV
ncbi:MAG: hypothetical protein BJ554DRAFT_5720 [Olpidium bornovanus]|uniref:Uncharacterized protein n=1 Tax=Olpidium bornovanus TaxID=278681 RepID=A0A8H8DKS5_9FUNG|nr:MAG: hypothetical protein BJ554DRAFT_5720 [Olpidium bornovanus]